MFGLVNVENVVDGPEVAEDVVMATHVGGHDAADDVLTQTPVLLDGQVVERVRAWVLQQTEPVRAVVVLERSDVVVALSQRRTRTYLRRQSYS